MQRAGAALERTGACEPSVAKAPNPFAGLYASHPLLSIPRLSIPATVGIDRMEREYANLLLLFWEEGIRPKQAGSVMTMAGDVINQWLNPLVKDLSLLIGWRAVTAGYDRLGDSYEPGPPGVCLAIDLDGGSVRFMEKRLGKLEKSTKGLGEAALYWAQIAGYRTIEVMTPEVACHVAEYLWWNGEADESEWIRFCKEELEYSEEDVENLIGPKAFRESFPDWVIDPKKPDLSKLDPRSRDGKKVMEILTQMEAYKEGKAHLPAEMPGGYERIHWGAYLLWKADHCPVIRVIDDHYERANQGGDYMTEIDGYEAIPMDRAGFKKWKARMEKGFEMLNLLDRLLPLISEER